jgi:hypothetical protein
MADASEDWAIEHIAEQQYEIISLLNYDATDVEVWGPNVTDPTAVEQDEWRERYEVVEAGQRSSVALTPRSTGAPASCRLKISWTDPSDQNVGCLVESGLGSGLTCGAEPPWTRHTFAPRAAFARHGSPFCLRAVHRTAGNTFDRSALS